MPVGIRQKVHFPDGNKPDDYYSYVCGHCGHKTSGAVLASIGAHSKWLLCTECMRGTFWFDSVCFPGVMFGPDIEGLPDDINSAYDEARQCMSVGAYTGAELLCRKILMHIAADKGADEGKSFAHYLTYLEGKGYITPPMKAWTDVIRQHGNKATHKLDVPTRDRAEGTVMFTAELLRLIYEMDYLRSRYTSTETT